ncbi:MAG: hypothetical protein OCC49_16255 [Fibrobacterales bacterium]
MKTHYSFYRVLTVIFLIIIGCGEEETLAPIADDVDVGSAAHILNNSSWNLDIIGQKPLYATTDYDTLVSQYTQAIFKAEEENSCQMSCHNYDTLLYDTKAIKECSGDPKCERTVSSELFIAVKKSIFNDSNLRSLYSDTLNYEYLDIEKGSLLNTIKGSYMNPLLTSDNISEECEENDPGNLYFPACATYYNMCNGNEIKSLNIVILRFNSSPERCLIFDESLSEELSDIRFNGDYSIEDYDGKSISVFNITDAHYDAATECD